MSVLKRMSRQPWFQKAVGVTAAEYLRFVAWSARFHVEPADIYSRIEPDMPIIVAMWHGQHFMIPFLNKQTFRTKVLISRHRDGEINAIASDRLGVKPIRGSGAHGNDFHRKGGVTGFRAMLAALQDGWNVATTADIPKVSRVAGPGIVKLAQLSGRPIYPVAVVTSNRYELGNWDKSVINLPFGKCVGMTTDPIRVPADADEATLEQARQLVESRLNEVHARAYAYVDGNNPRG
jgi:lysophospholipid acyltransferase (LPLAT)-like uncharacterized protein